MENPLIRCSQPELRARLDRLKRLIGLAVEAGIGRIVLPFVDNSRIDGDEEAALAALRQASQRGYRDGVGLRTDLDLEPLRQEKEFQAILDRLK